MDRVRDVHRRRRIRLQGRLLGHLAGGRGLGRYHPHLLPGRQDPDVRPVHNRRHPRGPLRARGQGRRGHRPDHLLHGHCLLPVHRRRIHPERDHGRSDLQPVRNGHRRPFRHPLHGARGDGCHRLHRPSERHHHRPGVSPRLALRLHSGRRHSSGDTSPGPRLLQAGQFHVRRQPDAQGGELLPVHPPPPPGRPEHVSEILQRPDTEGRQESRYLVDPGHDLRRDGRGRHRRFGLQQAQGADRPEHPKGRR